MRAFWGRALGYYLGTVLLLIIVLGGGVFGTMRAIGYDVSPRQVFWPPAWRELREVRAQLFVGQARTHYQAGRIREAMTALMTAHEVAPDDYAIAITLAQVMQAGNPAAADGIYVQMLKQHPEKRTETARIWFLSLLARGRLSDVAQLALRQLPTDPGQAAVWTHALVFSARHLHDPGLLETAAAARGVPPAAAAVLHLEARVRQSTRPVATGLLLTEPLPDNFPYAFEQRAELLIEFGRPREARALLGQVRQLLSGRDVARLALAAYAAGGDNATLLQEADGLLAPAKNPGTGEVTLFCQHLIKYPNPTLLKNVVRLLEEKKGLPSEQKREAWYSALCAAGAAADRLTFDRLKDEAATLGTINALSAERLREFFFAPPAGRRLDSILPATEQMSVNLTYTLLDCFWTPEAPKL